MSKGKETSCTCWDMEYMLVSSNAHGWTVKSEEEKSKKIVVNFDKCLVCGKLSWKKIRENRGKNNKIDALKMLFLKAFWSVVFSFAMTSTNVILWWNFSSIETFHKVWHKKVENFSFLILLFIRELGSRRGLLLMLEILPRHRRNPQNWAKLHQPLFHLQSRNPVL